MIGVEIDSGLVTHCQISLGVGESTKALYMVLLILPVTTATLGICMCEGVVGESGYEHGNISCMI